MDLLVGAHPMLSAGITKVYAAMDAIDCPMRPSEVVRSTQRQQLLYAQGRTTPGAIVTNADGIVHLSNHQRKADGFGHAVDSVFVGADPYLEHDPQGSRKWAAYGALVHVVGLTWGGDWQSTLIDRPHAELPGLPSSKGPAVV